MTDKRIDNERRAYIGQAVVKWGAQKTRVIEQESIETCIQEVLAYVAHFCDRVGLDPIRTFREAYDRYDGNFEDGPPAGCPDGFDDAALYRLGIWCEVFNA